MAIKKPSQSSSIPEITPQQADILASQLADKPYGKSKEHVKKVIEGETARTSISLPKNLLETIEDIAMKNKREGGDAKSVSGVVREALELYLNSLSIKY